MNYVFYVCDMDVVPVSGHLGKMETERDIASHISRGLGKCIVKKYTEYDGTRLDAESVGIVFPARMWGVSLAVYSFLQHIRVSKRTRVYAVAVGECLSAETDFTGGARIGNLEQFMKLFKKYNLGDESGVYIRCIDSKRYVKDTERRIMLENDIAVRIDHIMDGLLFYNVADMKYQIPVEEKRENYEYYREEPEKEEVKEKFPVRMPEKKLRLANIFLDESMLEGVRLCRVM